MKQGLSPCENKLGEKTQNMPLCGGFEFNCSPYNKNRPLAKMPKGE
jgi:hypothetical protein